MRWLLRRPARSGRHSVNQATIAPTSDWTWESTPVAPFQRRPAGSAQIAKPAYSHRFSESGVFLGFADGSVIELAASDPKAHAFRALARTLTQAAP